VISVNLSFSQLECPLEADAQFFFLHIPKTAGTTLTQIILQQFDAKEIASGLFTNQLIDAEPSFFTQHRCFCGHVESAVMSAFLPQEPVSITMLREPVARYLSHFNFYQRVPVDQLTGESLEVLNQFKQTSLERFVYDPPEFLTSQAYYFQNLQSKMLASEFKAGSDGPRVELRRLFEIGYQFPPPCFAAAKQRLDQLAFVGVAERFQDALFLVAYTFGWQPVVEYSSFNISPTRPSGHHLEPDLEEQIHSVNQIDQQVYGYGRQLFETRYEQMCQELLERYGRREHAHLKLPLSNEVMVELLDAHYQQRFIERNPAVPGLKLEFDRKISGRNWQGMEQDLIHGAFRWSGPGRCSILDLPLAASANVWLRFLVAMSMSEDLLLSLTVKVNDEQIQVECVGLEGGATLCEGYVPQAVLALRPGCVRVSFELAKTVKPIDVIPGNDDDRSLGIALNWVEVEPALPLVEECNRLKALLRTTEDALAKLQA
jgi:Sulfotransferase family